MPALTRGSVVLFLTWASACSSGTGTPTSATPRSSAPSPTPGPTLATSSVIGQVTDATTSAPISGVTVVFSYPATYATTDDSGDYRIDLVPGPGQGPGPGVGVIVWASDRGPDAPASQKDTYEPDFRNYESSIQNFHLYPVQRVAAGDSAMVTVTPEDTLCINNLQDSPPWPVCRSVRVVAPTDGIITLEALSTSSGVHPPLEVETVGVSPCCSERMGNPTSIQVTAGTEVKVRIELPSSTSQTFTLKTGMTRQ